MEQEAQMRRIRAVKDKYEQRLLRKRNVVGVGIGHRRRGGQDTDELVLTVMVRHKEPRSALRGRDVIPSELDGVPVDVQSVGEIRAQ
jgi:hypothetical protein